MTAQWKDENDAMREEGDAIALMQRRREAIEALTNSELEYVCALLATDARDGGCPLVKVEYDELKSEALRRHMHEAVAKAEQLKLSYVAAWSGVRLRPSVSPSAA